MPGPEASSAGWPTNFSPPNKFLSPAERYPSREISPVRLRIQRIGKRATFQETGLCRDHFHVTVLQGSLFLPSAGLIDWTVTNEPGLIARGNIRQQKPAKAHIADP